MIQYSFCCQPKYNEVIAKKFVIWHHDCTVVLCAKFCRAMIPYGIVRQNQFCIEFKLPWKNRSCNGPYIHQQLVTAARHPVDCVCTNVSDMIMIDEASLGSKLDRIFTPWHTEWGSQRVHWQIQSFFNTKISHATKILLLRMQVHVYCTWLTHKQQEAHGCAVSSVATDVLVLMHGTISSHGAD